MNVKVFSDRFIVCKKSHPCTICFGDIPVDAWVRARTERFYGMVKTFYFCEPCCAAMASSWDDAGRAIEGRTKIGIEHETAEENAIAAAAEGVLEEGPF